MSALIMIVPTVVAFMHDVFSSVLLNKSTETYSNVPSVVGTYFTVALTIAFASPTLTRMIDGDNNRRLNKTITATYTNSLPYHNEESQSYSDSNARICSLL